LKKQLIALSIILFSLGLIFSSFIFSPAFAANNLLKNSSFDEASGTGLPLNWGDDPYNCEIIAGGVGGGKCLKISNTDKEQFSLGAQIINLDGKTNKYLTVGGFVKLENVRQGKEAWQKANIQALFLDANGKQIGGWPELGPWDGSFGWKEVKKIFLVPAEAKQVKIVLGLYNCKGTAYFDQIYADTSFVKDDDPDNLTVNGKLEIWEDWVYTGSPSYGIASPGYNSPSALRITNSLPLWSFASQPVALPPNAKKIKVEAAVKLEGVEQGGKPWQQARINLEFKDQFGTRLGGWPVVFSDIGTSDWKKIETSFDVPEGSKRVDLFAGLLETKGTIWVDSIKVSAYDEKGKVISRTGVIKTNTSGWLALDQGKITKAGSALDVSFILDKPAGKHGFVGLKDGHFVFADGKPAVFWGVNIVAKDCFPSKEEADAVAERLSRSGVNLVRLHHVDAFWSNPNIFDPKYDDTQHLSADSLNRFDYLIAQLKAKGIYVFIDLLVDRQFKAGDKVRDFASVERGAKFSGFFNPRIIELQKLYAQQLLSHVNPYTGLAYKDEPAVVSVKLINEALLYYVSLTPDLPQSYVQELDQLWNVWLKNKYGNRENLQTAWTDKYGRCDLQESEAPGQGTVKRGKTLHTFQRNAGLKIDPLRERDTMLFYYEVQNNYYKDMEKYLRSLGVKVPISGSNHWVNVDADKKSNANLDYIDTHRYWDHPQFGYGSQTVFEDVSLLKLPKTSLPAYLGSYRVANKPFVISEWNACYPNEWRQEAPIFMAAYGSLHDWDAMVQFSYGGTTWPKEMQDNFNINEWPNVFSMVPASSLAFCRGDIAPAKNTFEETLSDRDVFGPIFEDQIIFNSPYLPLISRTQKRYVSNQSDKKAADFEAVLAQNLNEKKQTLTSDTKQLSWDFGKGIFKIDSPRTQAIVGFIQNQNQKTKYLAAYVNNQHASVVLTSLQGASIPYSKRLLLSVSGRVENTNQKFNSSKTMLESVGNGPVLIEPVTGQITLRRSGMPTVWALDLSGKRVKQISVTAKSGGATFRIGQGVKALNYEIVY
jgi:hypothetical protein